MRLSILAPSDHLNHEAVSKERLSDITHTKVYMLMLLEEMLNFRRPDGFSGLTVFHKLLRLNSCYHLGPALKVLHGPRRRNVRAFTPISDGTYP